jgi:MSHA biogenesis protein MshP
MTRQSQRGFGAIAAIMVLVILAGLSAAIVSFSTGQQLASAQDVLAARAWQVASAGTEGGLFRALQNATCDTQTWTSADDAQFKVTVVCTSSAPNDYKDGETAPGTFRLLRVFRVVATACNTSAAACPDDAASAGPGYVERQRIAIAYCEWSGAACTGP